MIFNEFDLAFKAWETISRFKFNYLRNNSNADITIEFLNSQHNKFDIDVNFSDDILGHAFFPESGRIHMNDEKKFSLSTDYRDGSINLFYSIIHEIGHSLGLKHVSNIDSIMFPAYIPKEEDAHEFRFARIDSQHMKALYKDVRFKDESRFIPSKKSIETKEIDFDYPKFNPCTEKIVDWCSEDINFDKAFNIDKYLFLYKQNDFWIYTDENGILPKRFSHNDYWNIPNDDLVSIIKLNKVLHSFYDLFVNPIQCNVQSLTWLYKKGNVSEQIDVVFYNETKNTLYLFSNQLPRSYYKVEDVTGKPILSVKPVNLFNMDRFDYDYGFHRNNNFYFVKNNIVDYYDFHFGIIVQGINFKDLFLSQQCHLNADDYSFTQYNITKFNPELI